MAGTKNSGRRGHGVEKNYLKELDRAIPEAVVFCELLIKEAIEIRNIKINEDNPIAVRKYWGLFKIKNDLAMKAAQTLINKAPQRVMGSEEDGSILIKQVILDV